MVGDGINDLFVFVMVDVGIVMVFGMDVVMEVVDVVFMWFNDLMDIFVVLYFVRMIFRRIKMNLLWVCMYNVVGLLFVMGLFLLLGWYLYFMVVGVVMVGSSVSVVVSLLFLKFWKWLRWMEEGGFKLKGVVERMGDGIVSGMEGLLGVFMGRKGVRGEGYVLLDDLENGGW